MENKTEIELVINGENEILGRVASYAAKNALQGKTVIILNCDKVLISGNKAAIMDKYLTMRMRKAVHYPSVPEQIVKRTIRGMIKHKSGRGAAAFKKIKCYNNTPEEYQHAHGVKLGNKNIDLMTVKEMGDCLSREDCKWKEK